MIGIHVFGPGFGESIVIELPDRTVGVIDVCRAGGRILPLQFLNSQSHRLVWDPLRFLAVTHPHRDHCLGVGALRKVLSKGIDQLWLFNAIKEEVFFRNMSWITAAVRDGAGIDKALLGVDAEMANLNERIDEFTKDYKKNKVNFFDRIRYIGMAPGSPFDLACGRDTVRVWFLTPGDIERNDYVARLGRPLEKYLSKESRGMVRSSADPNRASGSIMIEYGKTRLLFMADAEGPLWNELANFLVRYQDRDGIFDQPFDFIKVAHHASNDDFKRDGFLEELYAKVCSSKTVGVLTPFDSGDVTLPHPDAVREIAKFTGRLYCTNCHVSPEVFGVGWNTYFPNRLADPRKLTGQLDAAHDSCRVSVYFDDQGNKVRGPEDGQLAGWV